MNWMLVTPAVLAAFLGLMIAATHVLKKRFEMN